MTQKAKHGIYEDFGDNYGDQDLVDFDLSPTDWIAEASMERKLRELENSRNPRPAYVPAPERVLTPEEEAWCTIEFL
jgi:hypothetical protein